MTEPLSESRRLKSVIRKQALANLGDQLDRDGTSRMICEKFVSLPEFAAAATVMCYVHFRDEVRTRPLLPDLLAGDKRIVVPYCAGDDLGLFVLENMDELSLGTYGIQEPKAELRSLPRKRVEVNELDLIMVPGVAFDRQGGRLGHGKGYYDKLLEHVRPGVSLVALAFECQLFPEIPVDPHDVYMDKVLTERAVYEGRGRFI